MTYKRVGGLVFWRVGKLGGSFYWAVPRPDVAQQRAIRRAKRANIRRAARYWHLYGSFPTGE
jgi:hypothetical protein